MYQQWVNTSSISDPNDTLKKITYLNSKPFLDNSYANGAAVLYPTVTEYTLSSHDESPLGKTVYSYSINSNTVSPGINMTPLHSDARDSWRNIVPRSVEEYRYEGGQYMKLRNRQYIYAPYIMNHVPAAQTYLNWYTPDENEEINFGTPPGIQKFPHISYDIICGAEKLEYETDTTFDAADPARYMVSRTDYEYEGQHLYPVRKKTTNSRGYTRTTSYWYAHQSGIPGYEPGQITLLSNLKNSNRIVAAVKQTDTINGMAVQTKRKKFLGIGSYTFLQTLLLTHNAGVEYNEGEIIAYDKYGNIREQEVGGIHTTYLWGYNSLYPVAKIIGSTYSAASSLINQPLIDNVHTTEEVMRNELDQLRTALADAQVWTYTYLPGIGIASTTDPNGRSTFYRYDPMGRLIEIKDNDGNLIGTHDYHYVQP